MLGELAGVVEDLAVELSYLHHNQIINTKLL